MTPDFGQWLLRETVDAERQGRVFNLVDQRFQRRLEPHRVGEIICKIGKKARVVVDKATGKYASAHDCRRSFGTRWAKRVMPAVLKRLMRHADISTTMGYYVDMDADEMAVDLWAKFGTDTGNAPAAGNTLGNSDPKEAGNEASPIVVSDYQALT
jgi:integrase